MNYCKSTISTKMIDDGVDSSGVPNLTTVIEVETDRGEKIKILITSEGTEILVGDDTVFES